VIGDIDDLLAQLTALRDLIDSLINALKPHKKVKVIASGHAKVIK
jgi:hypothetical protein